MAFRETAGSMRAYFILVGVLGGLNNVYTMRNTTDTFEVILAGLGLAIAIGLLCCGAILPRLLKNEPQVINIVLYATLGYTALTAVLMVLYGHSGSGLLVGVVIGFVIAIYLLANVKRLHEDLKIK